jgi:hypothetical protein
LAEEAKAVEGHERFSARGSVELAINAGFGRHGSLDYGRGKTWAL